MLTFGTCGVLGTRLLGLPIVAALLVGCGASPATAPPSESPANPVPTGDAIESPTTPDAAGQGYTSAVAESVRAYLHALRLNERDLPEGFSIPFGYLPPEPRSEARFSTVYAGGVARATGKIGPRGHAIYDVRTLSCDPNANCFGSHKFIEIAPEPDAPAAPSPTSSATSPAPRVP